MPVAFHRGQREIEDVARFLERQPAEESQLGDPALSRIESFQFREGEIEIEDVDVERRRDRVNAIERDLLSIAEPLGAFTRPGAIDEDAPHHLRRDRQELGAVLPRRATLIDETQIRLVYERGRLKGVALSFLTQVRGRAVPQLLVDECHNALARGQISVPPRLEEFRDVVWGGAHWLPGEPDLVGLDGSQSRHPALARRLP